MRRKIVSLTVSLSVFLPVACSFFTFTPWAWAGRGGASSCLCLFCIGDVHAEAGGEHPCRIDDLIDIN